MTKHSQFAVLIALVSKSVLLSFSEGCSPAGESEKNLQLSWRYKPHFMLALQQGKLLVFIAS